MSQSRTPRDNFHPEGPTDVGHFGTDLPKSQDPKSLAAQHVAENQRPFTPSDGLIALRDATHHPEHETESQFRSAVAARSHGDDNSCFGSGRYIYVIGVISRLGDDFKVGERLEYGRRKP